MLILVESLKTWLPWILSATTIYMSVLAGNLRRRAWSVGLMNQMLWLVWILASESWGLLPLNICLWIVYARNYLKWKESTHDRGFRA